MRKLVIATAIVAASMTAMAADKLDMTIRVNGRKFRLNKNWKV
jgi:hypothetical protein